MKNSKKTDDKARASPVFFDPTSRRLVFFVTFSFVFVVLAVSWLGLFFAHLYQSELPPNTTEVSPPAVEDGSRTVPRYQVGQRDHSTSPVRTARDGDEPLADLGTGVPAPTRPSQARLTFKSNLGVHAFIPHWSMAGIVETSANIDMIDVLLPEWFVIDGETGAISDLPGLRRDTLEDLWLKNRQRVGLFPVARAGISEGEGSQEWLVSAKGRETLARQAVSMVSEKGFDGLCIDLPRAAETEADAIIEFAGALKIASRLAELESCLIIASDDPIINHPEASDLADRLIVLAFQEPGPFSGPSPLAAQSWYEDRVAELLDALSAENVVIALGNFGMGWISGEAEPEYLNFFDITEAASRHGGEIKLDHDSLNATMSFRDGEGKRHQVWFLDALSAHNQLLRTPLDRIGGVALWPVSGGDPGIWGLLAQARADFTAAADVLQEIPPAFHVRYKGKGPLLTVETMAVPGRRILSVDPKSGLIETVDYVALPHSFTVALSGDVPDASVIFTFDDGPSRTYTPQILDILKEHDVPAVFFVVGSRVQTAPDITRRIVAEGHELGVHTYSHPNIADVSDLRLKLELHATQELIENVSGKNTNLFRAPYGFDENPSTPDEARVLSLLGKERYVVVGIEIDSSDWTLPGADKIAERVTDLVKQGKGSVVLFHDAGGNREQTIQALPEIIAQLRGAGFSIVSLSSILGQSALVGPAGASAVADQISSFSFWLIRTVQAAITAIFVFVISVGILRALAILVLALIKERRAHQGAEPVLPVTVVIPAYCEETVIAKSVASVLQSTYPITEILVIDDGSSDGTSQVVRDTFASEPRVRLVRQENQGKSGALNHAIELLNTPVFVAIDADTIISPDAIGLLVRHFNDDSVGAVAGNVKVGNRKNLLTRLQAIEYITAQNLDRRAFEVLNGIMVVPGSIGGWRTEAVVNAGGYASDTIVEDADLTVSIIRENYKVVYEPAAHAFTEAPETVVQWMRQRLRWHFGMLQTAWKHKSAALERRAVGLVSIPDLVLFGAVFSIFAPIADVVMLVNVYTLVSQFVASPSFSLENIYLLVAVAYVAYLLSDLVLATIAFGLEPDEDKRLLPWVLTQRFFYRQLYWMVALRSIARAVSGRFTGWRKITRTSSIDPTRALGLSRAHGRTVSTDRSPEPEGN